MIGISEQNGTTNVSKLCIAFGERHISVSYVVNGATKGVGESGVSSYLLFKPESCEVEGLTSPGYQPHFGTHAADLATMFCKVFWLG
jgi:hypothetical protein